MKYLNFIFVIDCVRDVERNSNIFYLRTQDGRIIDSCETCNFTETLEDFIKKLSNNKDVHEQ